MRNSCLLMHKFNFCLDVLLSSDSLVFFFLLSMEACRIIDLPQDPSSPFFSLFVHEKCIFVSYLIP